jgi:hypothetical protein
MAKQAALERLSAAFRTEVDDATRKRHVAEMQAAIRTAPPAPAPGAFALRYRIAGAAAAVVVFVAPVGMAVAAENAVPGEFLYPVKQITERVRGLVDDDIAATHRVEEAERLVVRGAPIVEITRAVERAEHATSDMGEVGVLGPRLESVRERLRLREEGAPSSAVPEVTQSGRENTPSSGLNDEDSEHGQRESGGGSATTSEPGSTGHADGGERSRNGEPETEEVSPPDDNAGTGANQDGGNGTTERDGDVSGSGTAPATSTSRLGSDATNSS